MCSVFLLLVFSCYWWFWGGLGRREPPRYRGKLHFGKVSCKSDENTPEKCQVSFSPPACMAVVCMLSNVGFIVIVMVLITSSPSDSHSTSTSTPKTRHKSFLALPPTITRKTKKDLPGTPEPNY